MNGSDKPGPVKYLVKEPIVRYGVVALLDVLGVSMMNIEETKRYYDQYRVVLTHLQNRLPSDIKVEIGDSDPVPRKEWLRRGNPHHVFTFGDSILLIWLIPKKKIKNIGFELVWAAHYLSDLFFRFTHSGLPVRGALAHGELFVDSPRNVVLGPAISAAASYYEAANWLGIVASPDTGKLLLNNIATANYYAMNSYIPYDVPLSKGGHESLMALNWPFYYGAILQGAMGIHFSDEEDYWTRGPYALFFDQVKKMTWFGGNQKYMNSLKFYRSAVQYMDKYETLPEHILEKLKIPFMSQSEHRAYFDGDCFGIENK